MNIRAFSPRLIVGNRTVWRWPERLKTRALPLPGRVPRQPGSTHRASYRMLRTMHEACRGALFPLKRVQATMQMVAWPEGIRT